MRITDAVPLVKSARLSASRRVALICAFEPLHLQTFVQAFLVTRMPEDTPEVVTFGFDQLPAAFDATATSLRTAPALFCLSWSDLHPALSWRTRVRDLPDRQSLGREAARFSERARRWLAARHGAETYVVPPPLDFLPLVDPIPTDASGDLSLAASAHLATLLADLSAGGARVLRIPPFELNLRDLLSSGCPLSLDHAERIARTFVDLAFPRTARKKAVVTDLDGTLWHGIVGEDGASGIACGTEGKGYAFRVFQEFLLKLKREGMMLAFSSRNNPADVLPIFDSLEMPLKLSDFAAYRCDWEPKSVAVQAIARDLNISVDSIILVDDDAAELAEVVQRLPDVTTFQTPREGQQWLDLMRRLQDLCATWTVSDEDRLRSNGAARARQEAQKDVEPSRDGALTHLRDMRLEVTIHEHAFGDPRTLALINRTNQFNLTGERFAPDQWLDWSGTPHAFCWSARLEDRFGDFGAICVVTGVVDAGAVRLRQLVVSCRALNRGVESVVLGALVDRMNARELRGPFVDTGRNEPARRFLASLGCDAAGGEWQVPGATVTSASQRVMSEAGLSLRFAAAADLKTIA